MPKNAEMTERDLPAEDLDRRMVVPGKIGVSGRVSKAAKDLARQIGLPHKDAWSTEIAVRSIDGEMVVGKAVVWPIRTWEDVEALVADLRKAGLPDAKKADLEEFLIKQARSPDGFVLAARPTRMRNASAVLSLFREVEVGRSDDVGYHVHVEEMVDFSTGGVAGDALRQCFSMQAEADLAVLAHRLKDAGQPTSVAVCCESNNADTHDFVPALADVLDEALDRIHRNPKFAESVRGIDFDPPDYACHR
jgi:hypothetical protein